MAETLGIDFGTQFLRAAVWNGGVPQILSDKEHPKAHALLPTLVTERLEWGWQLSPERRKFPMKKLLYLMSETEFLKIDQLKKVLPLFLNDASMRIKHMKANIVVTIPSAFPEEGKKLLLEACEKAGLHALGTLPEAEAVCLANVVLKKKSGLLAVWMIGAGFCEMLLAEAGPSEIQVLASESLEIGGFDFDRVILSALISEMSLPAHLKSEEKFLAFLEEEVKKAKESLSIKGSYDFKVTSKQWGFNYTKAFSRFEMGQILQPFVHKMETAWRRILKKAEKDPAAVQEVILAGGCSRMFVIHETVQSVFGKKGTQDLHPEEAAVLGALVEARGRTRAMTVPSLSYKGQN